MKIYIAGPMRGIKEFNFPAFFKAAQQLRADGHEVFSPAERDIALHGDQIWKDRSGDLTEISHIGFSLREAIADDLNWICRNGDAVALLPGWEKSSGATLEKATADFLKLQVIYL